MPRFSHILLMAILIAGASSANSFDLTEGLVAHYPLDGNAQDISGQDNYGVPNANAILTTDRFGQVDAAYHFNGINSHIIIPGSTSLDSANPFGSSTSISFRLPETSSVTIDVIDLAGRRVRQQATGRMVLQR